jgi:hypothetical protein
MDHRFLSRWTGVALTLSLLCGNAGLAGELRYLAWDGSHARAVVEIAGAARSLSLGDPVPGYGAVIELDPSHIVLRRVLSDAEREDLARRGSVVHRAEKVLVIREDLRFHAIPMRLRDTRAPNGYSIRRLAERV